jgi:hypothetical protein
MIYAQIKYGLVLNVVVIDDSSLLSTFLIGYDFLIEIDQLTPMPQVGWIYNAAFSTFTPPPYNPIVNTNGSINVELLDSSGIGLTSTTVSASQALDQNLVSIGGSSVVTGIGVSGSGIPRVTVSNDSNILASQSGTWNITNISGTVSLPTGAATGANQTAVHGSVFGGTAATSSTLIGAQYNSTLPTLTNTQQSALQLDSSGRLMVSPPLNATINYTAAVSSTGNLFSQNGMLQYDSFLFAITGTFSATIQAQASNDGTTYFTVPVTSITNLTEGPVSSITTPDFYYLPITFQWLKIVVTNYVSGTVDFNGYVSNADANTLVPYKVQLQDNIGNGLASINNQLETRDVLSVAAQSQTQSIGTSAAQALGGATILSNRKLLHITPTNGTIYWGYTSGVTTNTGTPLFPNNTLWLSVTNNISIYLVAATTTNVITGELS